MPVTPRAEGALNLNLSGLPSMLDSNASTPAKSPFAAPKGSSSSLSGLSNPRIGAGSPLHEQPSRLFPKRTRELQTPTGTSTNIWGPPTSGTSTPLFEIPESPSQDGFPDLVPLTETGINSPARRGRAGTLPSRISPTTTTNASTLSLLTSKTSRPTPSTSPFRPASTSASEKAFNNAPTPTSTSTLLSRLRAGSMPQRASLFATSGYSTPFSTAWSSRARAATLTSISSAEDPASPQQQSGREDLGVRTLDYLGLVESNDPKILAESDAFNTGLSTAFLTSYQNKNSNRFRSFSVNAQPKQYANNTSQANALQNETGGASGTMTPSAAAAIEAEYEAIQERVRLHNKAVQDFALNASAARPRARTAGLVDAPQRSVLGRFGQKVIEENDLTDSHTSILENDPVNQDLSTALYNMNMTESAYPMNTMDHQSQPVFDFSEDTRSSVSRSLWIGSIPNSTTVSTLNTIFQDYGPIESARVLTHKNCGFVNFENLQDAVRARQLLNGKEIFPGSGPVRIGFAKAPSNNSGMADSQGLDPFAQGDVSGGLGANMGSAASGSVPSLQDGAAQLSEMQAEILEMIRDFGAQEADLPGIQNVISSAVTYDYLQQEIPPLTEPTRERIFDAPRLRDIRKRIDNGSCTAEEIESIAMEMLPEISELSSDYLGNTVVQKLFEYCSEEVKEQMLTVVAPHLAEIGVHKNGTWAAQKIIDVCRSDSQIRIITEHLRPYTVPLFLDQFGNYVLQCCLRFGPAYNGYIFETMLSQLWNIAQGRFGARAMRACLESHHSSKDQQRMLAAVISLYSVRLATNANGALLLTWLLDTCTFPKRRSVLAPRLIPHLVQLCTHKVAYLTVLKVVNQRNEPEARDAVLKALFFSQNESTLEQILSDQTSGVTLIFKIITSPSLDDSMRPDIIRSVSSVLVRMKAQPNQGYKRLMDEVGLSSSIPRQPQSNGSYGHSHPSSRPMSQAGNKQFNGGYTLNNNSEFNSGYTPIRSTSGDSFSYPSFPQSGFQSQQQQAYNQMPYQQMTPQTYAAYNTPGNRNSNTFMSNGMGGGSSYSAYNTPPPMDFRNMQANTAASPIPYNAHLNMSPMMSGNQFGQQYGQQNLYGMNGHANGYAGAQQGMYGYNPQTQGVYASGKGRPRRQNQY